MKLTGLKKILAEDFPADQRPLVGKLALLLNPMVDQLTTLFNNNIGYDNLNQLPKQITVIVDGDGFPTQALQIKNPFANANKKCVGIRCINAQNTTNTVVYPTSTPFLSFSEESFLITVNHIAGLQAGYTYTLYLIIEV